jgi:hydroxyethylthiazole kinase-like sugar kinase family protein
MKVLGQNPLRIFDTTAAQAGVLSMNIAAEKAYKRVVDENRGTGSFKAFLLDEIYMVKCEKEDP